jgi:hypothetical protein
MRNRTSDSAGNALNPPKIKAFNQIAWTLFCCDAK